MKKINPFKVKGLASGNLFFNRTAEKELLARRAWGGQNTLLIAPRRYGKSSLLEVLTQELRHEIKVANVDLFRCARVSEMVSVLGRSMVRAQTEPWEKISGWIKKGLPKLAPKFSISAQGEPEFSFDVREKSAGLETLDELLVWFDRTPSSGRKLLILDEVQELLSFENATEVEKHLRASIQRLKNTTVFFSGSLPSVLQEMFTHKKRAFYQSALVTHLELPPLPDAVRFLENHLIQFRRPGLTEWITEVVRVTQGHPYYVQLAGYFAWERLNDSPSQFPAMQEVIEDVLAQEQNGFETTIEPLTGIQRQVYRAIALYPGVAVTSHQFIADNHLGAHSTVRATAKRLLQLGHIKKSIGHDLSFEPTDPLLAYWMTQK